MGSKGIGKGKRLLLHVLQHGMAVTAAVCIAVILLNACFVITMPMSGNERNMMYPWETEGSFEDSYIFERYLRDSISGTLRIAVIKQQMELNGVYEGKKRIDIYEYLNRKNDTAGQENEIRAEYYLEDLIKWNDYGFEYHEIERPSGGWDSYFASQGHTEEQITHYDYPESGKVIPRTDFYDESTFVQGTSGNYATEAEAAEPNAAEAGQEEAVAARSATVITITEDIAVGAADAEQIDAAESFEYREGLKERYQSADGKNIRDFVSDWDSYNEFCYALQEASQQLGSNYAEYKKLSQNYSADTTNLRYCIRIPDEEESHDYYFANDRIPADGAGLTEHYREYGQYLYYKPEHMKYETNTPYPEAAVRNLLEMYDYVYPENTEIWFAIDTDYPVRDSLWQGKLQFDSFKPRYILWLSVLAASVVIYLALWIYLTVKEGKPCKIVEDGEERNIILSPFDRIPSELMLLFALGVGYLMLQGIYNLPYLVYDSIPGNVFTAITAGFGLLVSLSMMFVYYSFVRRIKARVFFRHTIIAALLGWVFKWLKKGFGWLKRAFLAVYNDSSIVIRTILPYVLFLMINGIGLLLMLVFAAYADVWRTIVILLILLILLAVDVAVGVIQFRENRTRMQIVKGIEEITRGNLSYQIRTDHMYGDNLTLARAVNCIGEGIRAAVETSMKDERLKADLITNVSHDIKTPLTSIINYVDLIRRENIQDEKVKGYIEVLDTKSQRLKQLTEDLVEASKISSGNMEYHFESINFVELIHQTLGEFSEKFEEKNLTVVAGFPEEAMRIQADSRRIWRVIENLYNNICKYAMSGTRVYMDMACEEEDGRRYVSYAVKNISAQPLNIKADELTERFIRGDVSRSTEGSGLGLSIAKNLTQAQNGSFTIYLDGDLFKVILRFPLEDQDGSPQNRKGAQPSDEA